MQTTYPIIDVPADFTTFELDALQADTVSAAASVSADAVTSEHEFEQEVEAAIDLQTAINYPVTDSNAASMPILMPFEEVPGETTFNNYGTTTGYSQSTEMKSPPCYITSGCPTTGRRGVAGRAASFDGSADWLGCTYVGALGLPCAYSEINVRTLAAWVKADRGTIADFRSSSGSSGVELDFTGLNVTIGSTTYRIALDLPENEWAHVAATIDMTSRTARLYVNGALYGSTSLGASGTFYGSFPSIGANRPASLGNLGSNGDFFHGYMDELRVYTVTLSAAQIKQLYSESAPIMQFPFDADHSEASLVLDTSVNGYVGALRGTSCNTVTVNWVNVSEFTGDGLRVRLGSSDELVASIPAISANVYNLNATASFCGQDSLVFEAVAANNAVSTYATLSLAPLSAGTTGTVELGNPPFHSLDVNYTYGTSSGNAPAVTDGKIGNKLVLDGRGAVEVASPAAVSALTSTFSIMGWINPDDVAGFQQIIASGTDASFNNGFSLGLNDDLLQFRTFGVKAYASSAASVTAGVWQHVAVVFDSNYDALFYVNGALMQTIDGSAAAKANTDDPTYLGGSASTSGVLQDLFRGQLDELAIYDRQLTTNEIYSIYLRDLRWYSTRSAVALTIDTDAPTIELITDSAYQANAATTLVVSSLDATSGVRLLDVGIKKSTASAYSWSSAPLCAESISTARAASWCPSFDPTTLGGEGTYAIQFRAVDAVGNQTTSAARAIYVDATAP
ncbi:MAG TPA: LamG domain-containing protein, partial [Herpetosiphonaceae bacterium]|nr:LamG domain-containing protein [Herpetosiphonaceae bacterium]